MPKQSCPCPPDNCFPECVKCAVEKCKKACCERKYLKLAHKLLDNGLFVDASNYVRQEVFSARTSSQFYNITNAFANPDVDWENLQYDQPIIVNNQTNNLVSFRQLGFDFITVKQFTLAQLTSYTANGGDFTFVMAPIISLVFGKSLAPGDGYDTLQNAIESSTPTLARPGNPALLEYLKAVSVSTGEILNQVLPGGLAQVIISQDTPFVTDVRFALIDPTVTPALVFTWVGKAGLVSKLVNTSSPCTTESLYFLVVSARRIQDRHGPLPGPCDN
jgi:hypothetical protein